MCRCKLDVLGELQGSLEQRERVLGWGQGKGCGREEVRETDKGKGLSVRGRRGLWLMQCGLY